MCSTEAGVSRMMDSLARQVIVSRERWINGSVFAESNIAITSVNNVMKRVGCGNRENTNHHVDEGPKTRRNQSENIHQRLRFRSTVFLEGLL